jgi:hypothetical protein
MLPILEVMYLNEDMKLAEFRGQGTCLTSGAYAKLSSTVATEQVIQIFGSIRILHMVLLGYLLQAGGSIIFWMLSFGQTEANPCR